MLWVGKNNILKEKSVYYEIMSNIDFIDYIDIKYVNFFILNYEILLWFKFLIIYLIFVMLNELVVGIWFEFN